MIKTAGKGDICDTPAGVVQKMAAYFQPVCVQEIYGGLLQVMFEEPAAFAPADISGGGNLIQRDLFSVVLIEKGYHIFLNLQVFVCFLPVQSQFFIFPQSAPQDLHKRDGLQLISFCSGFLQSNDS